MFSSSMLSKVWDLVEMPSPFPFALASLAARGDRPRPAIFPGCVVCVPPQAQLLPSLVAGYAKWEVVSFSTLLGGLSGGFVGAEGGVCIAEAPKQPSQVGRENSTASERG